MSDKVAARTNTTHLPLRAVQMPMPLWDEVLEHLRAGLPLEACGLLGGRRDRTGLLEVEAWYPGTNVLASATRFRMDDGEVIRAQVAMREQGQELIGIVHSHPQTVPTLSPTDLREAFYRNIALIVVSFRTGDAEGRAWTVPPGVHAEPRPLDILLAEGT